MDTVFSHIVQKRFSQVNEDVATDALAFILNSSESARTGMMKLLRGIAPGLPDLQFQTQQSEGSIRPDMRGFDGSDTRVFVESKFWAGLTENQPVEYLKELASHTQPTILLVVVPEAREQTIWRELKHRLEKEKIVTEERNARGGVVGLVTTVKGPILALTSWRKLLSALELEVADEPAARSDLLQLRALCEAADSEAFIPISSAELTDQRTPAFLLQLGSIVQASVYLATTEGVLNISKLMPQASWERIGRYARVGDDQGVGMWFGIHFGLWQRHGGTPLWVVFSQGEFGRASEVRALVEPLASENGVFTTWQNNEFAVAVDIETGEERDRVVHGIVDRLGWIKDALSTLAEQR